MELVPIQDTVQQGRNGQLGDGERENAEQKAEVVEEKDRFNLVRFNVHEMFSETVNDGRSRDAAEDETHNLVIPVRIARPSITARFEGDQDRTMPKTINQSSRPKLRSITSRIYTRAATSKVVKPVNAHNTAIIRGPLSSDGSCTGCCCCC